MQVTPQRQRVFVLILGILFTVSPAYCISTYFVATTGSDTTGNGSIGNPYQTISHAVGLVAAGDTINVRGGTYTYTDTTGAITLPAISGTSTTTRCSLIGYNGERALLDFTAMTGTSANGLTISGSYWYVKGLDCKNAPHNGIKISGNYNTVEFCTSFENRNSGVGVASGAAYNQIINCDSYYNYDAPAGGNADGFSPKMDVGTGNYFYGCRSWQNSDDAYDGYLRGADDVNVTYENCWAFKNGYLKDANSTVHGNGNGFKMGGGDGSNSANLRHNVILKNCLAFNNYAKGFDQNHDKGSMNLYNCTAFNNGGNNFYISEQPVSGYTASVTNSTYYSTNGQSYSLGSFVVQTTNDWTTTSADFVSIDPAAAYGPRKADGSLPDITFMHLAAGSALINAGTDVGLPYCGTKPDLGCFEYCTNGNPPGQATAPNPTNGATGVSLTPTLSWTAGVGATSHDVYFGTAATPPLIGNQTGTTYTPATLTAGLTYYWRINEVNSVGTTTGTVWSFTTVPPPPPGVASNPTPTNGATAVSTTPTLSWTAGSGATSHDVYFGTAAPPPLIGNQAGTTYNPGTLTGNKTYYWRIDEKNAGGTTTGTVWSFTTAVAMPTFVAAGTGVSGTGNITVVWPTHVAGDIALLFIESTGGQAATLTTPAGFVNVTSSPQYTGATTAGTRLTVYWCRATSSSMASPVVTDPGDHAYGIILTFRGVVPTGDPWDVTLGGIKATASTTTTFATATTTVNNDLIVLAASRDNDSTSAAWGSWTNAALSSLTEQSDGGTTSGNGGGIGVATGGKATAGAIGSTTATVTSSVDGHITIALKPEAGVSLPGQATAPSPAQAAVNVSLTPTLSWTAGSGATSHDVYFGTAASPPFIGNQTGTTYNPATLTAGTTYYWRIDEKNAGGTTTGTVWSFTTVPPAPCAASSPTPTTGATNVSLTPTLSWTAGSGCSGGGGTVTSYDVYFGTAASPPFIGNQAGTTYNPGTLTASTTYYWRIDEKGPGGTTTGTVWNFTTAAAPGMPTVPSPAPGATAVSLTPTLSWTAGSGTTSHNVYFGTAASPPLIGNQAGTSYVPGTLTTSKTYYWRIDEVGPGGTTTGTVWSFTTVPAAPGQATAPSPANSATNVSTDMLVLSWSAGSGATSRDVYFGTVNPPVTKVITDGTVLYYPAGVAPTTTYYWRVDEKNAGGTTTGAVWSFTTALPPPSPTPSNGATNVPITTDLSWGVGSGSYNVYFGTAASPPMVSDQTATTYDTGTMAYSTTYYWRIDVKYAGGTVTGPVWHFTTQADTTAPLAPSGLTATAGYIPVKLDWNNNSESDLAGYNVYRSTTSGSGYSKLNGTLLTDSNYIDDINTTDITYYYVVTAVDTHSNESNYSNEVFSGLYGDFTGNKIVKLDDLSEFATYWLLENCTGTAGVDLNGDCIVNFDEFAAFADNWMK